MRTVQSLAKVVALVAVLLGFRTWALPLDAPRDTLRGKEEPPRPPKPSEVAELVRQLGHANSETREKAMRELIRLRGHVRKQLRAALASTDPEVRWRADYALSLLHGRDAEPVADPARTLYASAARARTQQGGAEAARTLYAEVAERFPKTRWARAARERLDELEAQRPRTPEKPPADAELEHLIAQLGAEGWAERQAASLRLADLGEAARDALQRVARGPDAETAWRARSLLERLAPQKTAAAKPEAPPARDPRLIMELLGEGARKRRALAQPNDIDGLVRQLAGTNAEDVAHAREVLANLGDDALDALLRSLQGCDETTGVEIMDLLHRITAQDLGFRKDAWDAWWRRVQEAGKE